MKLKLGLLIALLCCASTALALPPSKRAAKPAASPAASPAAETEEPICPEDLEAEALAKEKSEREAKQARRIVKSPLDVWNPHQRSDDGSVGQGFSRYSGADEYEGAGGTVAAEAPPKRGGGNAKASTSARPAGSGLRIRRG